MTIRVRSLLIALLLAVVLLIGCYYAALNLLKAQVEEALGPRGEVRSLGIAGMSIEMTGLRIAADKATDKAADKSPAWPVAEELRAERVLVSPDLRSLFTDSIVIGSVRIEHAYLPMLRTNKGLRLVPSLLAREKTQTRDEDGATRPAKTIRVGRIELVDGEIDFFDATLGRKVHRIPLRGINGQLEHLKLPALDESEDLAFTGSIPEQGHGTGTFSLAGALTPSNRDSNLKLNLHEVPLLALEPYFIKAAEAEVKRGKLDLDLEAHVKNRQLHAPGHMVLNGLELDGDGFVGLSRQVGLSLLKDGRDRLDFEFSLDGNLDDPKFSLNEQFYVRVGSALAKLLGVSVEGLGKGVGSVVEGVGGSLRKLFGAD